MALQLQASRKAKSTLDRERFEKLVSQAERMLESKPRAYRMRLALLAVLGYAVIFGALFLVIALIAGSVWAAFASTAFLLLLIKKKLIIVLALVAWVMIKSLWVRLEQPQGYTIERADAPRLFDDLDGYRKRLATPKIHTVILTEEFNAGIVQVPRLGIFGWHKNTLILGLPLLQALKIDEARAVVGHELGHLSGNHSRFNGWIYRVRIAWYRIMDAFDQSGGFGSGMLRRFFDWYAPYFNAYSFALARSNEYEADAIAAELTSSGAVARALVNSNVRAGLVDRHFWDKLIAAADQKSEPSPRTYSELDSFCREHQFDPEEVKAGLRSALEAVTGHADTHPALKDRLAAVGQPDVDIRPIKESAAQYWLGENHVQILQEFDRFWLERNEAPWCERYQYASASRERLRQLKERNISTLDDNELWALAALTEEFDADADPLPIYRAYSEKHAEDPDVNFVIGRLLLARDDESGISYLEKAAKSLWHAVSTCQLSYSFYLNKGNSEEAERWRLLGEQFYDRELAARQEREFVGPSDTLLDPELDDETLTWLRKQLLNYPKLRKAWIAKKQVKHLSDNPVYVLAFKTTWFSSAEKLVQQLAQEINFPAIIFFAHLGGETVALGKKVRKHGKEVLRHPP